MQQLKVNAGWWTFLPALRAREDFTTPTGTLRGKAGDAVRKGYTPGKLPACYHASIRRADYAVYSYDTPIAWHLPRDGGIQDTESCGGTWVTPEEHYSITTSKHQGRILTALSVIDDPAYCSACGYPANMSMCRCAAMPGEPDRLADERQARTERQARENAQASEALIASPGYSN